MWEGLLMFVAGYFAALVSLFVLVIILSLFKH
jgi:hypothetical protein